MVRAVSTEFKQFGKMPSELRRDVITKDANWQDLSKEDFEAFQKRNHVECLITYSKGAEKQIVAYLLDRGVRETDIIRTGNTNQIILRGNQESMQDIATALYVNLPHLITEPRNPYITNSDNFGDVKLSPKGVPFKAVLGITADLVEKAISEKGKGLTPGEFAESVYEKRLGLLMSGADFRETGVLNTIASNIEDKVGQEKVQKKLGTLAKSGISVAQFLEDGETKV